MVRLHAYILHIRPSLTSYLYDRRGSTFWNLTYHSGNGSVVNTNSMCIFEADMNFPLSRHRSGASNEFGFSSLGTVKGAQLIVRAIATVGNYGKPFLHFVFEILSDHSCSL
jgi:Cu2+-containing amine oxidase